MSEENELLRQQLAETRVESNAERTAREELTVDRDADRSALEAEKAQFQLGQVVEAFRLDRLSTDEQMQD